MQTFIEKTKELSSDLWIKLLFIIPPCFFEMQEKEKIMIVAFLGIEIIDCFFGAIVSKYIKQNFSWGLLGKKFSKKFLVYFFFMLASFLLSKAYSFVGFWFYVAGMLITLSEFGSLAEKAKLLGLPIKIEYISMLNKKIDNYANLFFGVKRKK